MKRGFIFSPNIKDSTSFWRVVGPIGQMQKNTDEWFFEIPRERDYEFNFNMFMGYDLFYINRPFTEKHFRICLLAKHCGLKLWVDYDDDVLNIPIANWSHEIYEKANAKKWVSEIAKISDWITVSTDHLKETIFSDADKVHVAYNALHNHMFPISDVDNWKRERPVVYWRGSKTHSEDVYLYLDAIEKLVTNHPGVDFCFIAETDWQLKARLKGKENVKFYQSMPLIEFNLSLKSLRPAVNIVPLAENTFNKSKSMCSWIEATHAGAVSVGPNFQEWQRPGICNYSDEGQFVEQVEMLLEDQSYWQKKLEASRKAIRSGLLIDQVNEKRFELLKEYV